MSAAFTRAESRARAGVAGRSSSLPARLVVRRATAGDLVPLTFFFDTLLRRDYFLRRGQLAEILRGVHHQLYVAELDSILVGAAVTTGNSHLVNILVHPAYRRLGIGEALVRASGAQSVSAKLDMSAGDPRSFYEALGFEGTGHKNSKGNIELMRLRSAGSIARSDAASQRADEAGNTA